MGEIRFKYFIHSLEVAVEQLVYELEYGNTFILGGNSEKMITLKLGDLFWVDWRSDQNTLTLIVNDQFFSENDLFEKILTCFIYNMMDFGQIKLISLDFSQSKWEKLIFQGNRQAYPKTNKNAILGTVIKPYYHTTEEERILFLNKMAAYNIACIKEDETYLLDPKTLKKNTLSIHSAIDSNIKYIPNITTAVCEYDLIETFMKHRINLMMVNIMVTGFRNIRKLKERFPEITLWGHRVGYQYLESLVSVRAFSQICLLAGISYLHIGTPCSDAEASRKNQLCDDLKIVYPDFIPVFTKTSPEIIQILQNNIHHLKVIMACGFFRDSLGMIDYEKVEKWATVIHDAP